MKRNVRNIKKLKELQNDDSAVVIYQDEVHFQVTTSVTRKWVIKGSEPKVKSAPSRKSVPYSGYVYATLSSDELKFLSQMTNTPSPTRGKGAILNDA